MVRLIRSLAVAVAAALLWSGAAMAQACGTVTTCPTASTPLSGSELLYLVQGGVSKKITVGSIFGTSQPANSIALSSLVNQPASTILANPTGTHARSARVRLSSIERRGAGGAGELIVTTIY